MNMQQEIQPLAGRLRSRKEPSVMGLTQSVGQTPRTLIWTKNKARLYRYVRPAQASVTYRTPLLMVYALINKPYILDLLPGRSLIEYLVNKGVDVYLLDWGIPGPEDQWLRFDDLVIEYLPRMVREVLRTSGEEHLHMLGYCIGGILTTLYAATHPEAPLGSLILLCSRTPIEHERSVHHRAAYSYHPHWQPLTLDALVQLLQAKERGDPVDKTTFDTQVAKAVEMVVRQLKNSSRVSNLCQSGMGAPEVLQTMASIRMATCTGPVGYLGSAEVQRDIIHSTTNFIEHPELVAERLFGFASVAGYRRVDPAIAWAKLQSLVEGALLASQSL